MKKLWMPLFLSLALLLAPGALAEEESATNAFVNWVDGAVSSVETWVKSSGELEARGQAVRTVAPDTAAVSVGVQIEKNTEKEAQEEANRIINDVTRALKEKGLDESQMATGGYNIRRNYNSSKLMPTKYVASISLRITVQDFDLINEILDTAVSLGANNVGGITFSHSQQSEIYKQALSDAILEAKSKAQAMADTAGVKLYTLLTLREDGGVPVYARAENVMLAEGGGSGDSSTQITAGEIEISAYVTLVYQVK